MLFQQRLVILFSLMVCQDSLLVSGGPSTSKRIDVLKDLAIQRRLRPEIEGKTWKELGVNEAAMPKYKPHPKIQRGVRGLVSTTDMSEAASTAGSHHGSQVLDFFSIYDEFGPAVSGMGESAGLNGLVYDITSYNNEAGVTESDVIGSVAGKCTVVGSDLHYCTYEIFVVTYRDSEDPRFGLAVASGSMMFKEGVESYLMVESADEDYKGYNGGLLSIKYEQIGEETIISGKLMLA